MKQSIIFSNMFIPWDSTYKSVVVYTPHTEMKSQQPLPLQIFVSLAVNNIPLRIFILLLLFWLPAFTMLLIFQLLPYCKNMQHVNEELVAMRERSRILLRRNTNHRRHRRRRPHHLHLNNTVNGWHSASYSGSLRFKSDKRPTILNISIANVKSAL